MKMGSNVLLGLAAFIWGIAFVAQRVGMDYVGPFTFNAARFIIGGLVLIPCVFYMRKNGETKKENRKGEKKASIIGGICCGIALFTASSLQQIGISYTTVGKAGFITALYIVIVPLLGIFMKKRVSWTVWISVVIATVGMYLLCITDGFQIGKGDVYVFFCAIVFSFHILVIDRFSGEADGVFLSCIQFFVCGAISAFLMFAFETPSLRAIADARLPLLYVGIFSSGIAYTFQIIGQKGLNPVVASLIMSLESVISAIAGWVILGQTLSGREIAGCAVMFLAILIAQI